MYGIPNNIQFRCDKYRSVDNNCIVKLLACAISYRHYTICRYNMIIIIALNSERNKKKEKHVVIDYYYYYMQLII